MGIVQSLFCTITFCAERVLTWACCAFVLMLLMFSILMLVVYGISVGYHYAQKELASFASSSRSTTMEPVLRRMGVMDSPVVRLVAVNKTEVTSPPEPLIEIYKTPDQDEQVFLDETVTPAVFLETENSLTVYAKGELISGRDFYQQTLDYGSDYQKPPEEPELSSNERELARKLIGRFRRSRNNTSSTSFLRPLRELASTVAVIVGNSTGTFIIS